MDEQPLMYELNQLFKEIGNPDEKGFYETDWDAGSPGPNKEELRKFEKLEPEARQHLRKNGDLIFRNIPVLYLHNNNDSYKFPLFLRLKCPDLEIYRKIGLASFPIEVTYKYKSAFSKEPTISSHAVVGEVPVLPDGKLYNPTLKEQIRKNAVNEFAGRYLKSS